MSGSSPTPTRREALVTALAAAALSGAFPAAAQTGATAMSDELAAHARDWAWLEGRWNVRHRRLKTRLANDTQWEEFNGTCHCWLTMGGFGTCDDNVIEIPSGTYRAMGVRGFDRETRKWAIWWLDERLPTNLGEPVRGEFRDGVGEFSADDTLNGRPIKVRFRWTDITETSARWEQAFSPDGGASWEVNWVMHFTRA